MQTDESTIADGTITHPKLSSFSELSTLELDVKYEYIINSMLSHQLGRTVLSAIAS